MRDNCEYLGISQIYDFAISPGTAAVLYRHCRDIQYSTQNRSGILEMTAGFQLDSSF